MKQLTIFLLLFSSTFTRAQNTFEFFDGMTTYTGTYDITKYTELELQNTLDLLVNSYFVSTPSRTRKIEDVEKLDPVDLKIECANRLNLLETMDFVDGTFWSQAKENRIRELNETCFVQELTIIGYENPNALLRFETDDQFVNYCRNALINGGFDLIDAWREVNEIMKAKNGFPEKLQKKFEEQSTSPQKMDYARIEVMMFGWWNHVNDLIYHDPEEDYFPEFEALFTHVESEFDGE